MGTAIDLPAYAARLLVLASACSTGARMAPARPETRDQHRAGFRAYVWAVFELQQRAQGVIEAAVVLLDEDTVRSPAPGYELRAAQASKLARHLLANLRLGAERLYDGCAAAPAARSRW